MGTAKLVAVALDVDPIRALHLVTLTRLGISGQLSENTPVGSRRLLFHSELMTENSKPPEQQTPEGRGSMLEIFSL